jgi:hypothetical protein
VLRREVEREVTPDALLVPNWIFARESDDFEGAMGEVVSALETDLEWLADHARLLVRATEWDRERRDSSFLLRGRDLKEAEAWLAEQGSHREAATSLQAGSRSDETAASHPHHGHRAHMRPTDSVAV